MQDLKSEAKIIEQINEADNILIAINKNPTVDQLVAALGLTIALNKNEKRATTIFSGNTPSKIEFLHLEKNFDKDVDGLREFIIALDTKKADYVKTKVVDDMVRISITPAKKAIKIEDLEFTQGDYNVDLVLALGVNNKNDLDKTLSNHGKILHNAFVASINVDSDNSDLGSVNWHEPKISSYSELAYNLLNNMDSLDDDSEGENENWIDQSVATAFLTGLVDITDRFRNEKTTPNILKQAGQLMEDGANQQLIVVELDKKNDIKNKEKSTKEDKKQNLNDESDIKEDKIKLEDDLSEVKEISKSQNIKEDKKTEHKNVEDILDSLIAENNQNKKDIKQELEENNVDFNKENKKSEDNQLKPSAKSFNLAKQIEEAEEKLNKKKKTEKEVLLKNLNSGSKKDFELSEDDLLEQSTVKKQINSEKVEGKQEKTNSISKTKQIKETFSSKIKKNKKIISPLKHSPGEKTNIGQEINKELADVIPPMPEFNENAEVPIPPMAPDVIAAKRAEDAKKAVEKASANTIVSTSVPVGDISSEMMGAAPPPPPPPPMPNMKNDLSHIPSEMPSITNPINPNQPNIIQPMTENINPPKPASDDDFVIPI